ncbi:hypothetical protein [Parafrankia sp. FMc2]
MRAIFARVAQRLADVLVCMICGGVGHTEKECGHQWDFHRGDGGVV